MIYLYNGIIYISGRNWPKATYFKMEKSQKQCEREKANQRRIHTHDFIDINLING